MGVLAGVAEFERDLLIERTAAGLARSRANGVKPGRREALSASKQIEVLDLISAGVSVSKLARDYGTSRQTIIRIREKRKMKDLDKIDR